MKLVEILARELEEWPSVDGVECGFIVQESDGGLYTTHDKAPTHTVGNHWWRQDDDDGKCGYLEPTVHMKLAEDWEAAIITRADWEAERARIKGEKTMQKPNKDGWIRHRGGECPVDAEEMVDVRFRYGDIDETGFKAGALHWGHIGECADIMAWRPHNPEHQIEPAVIANVDAFNARAEMQLDGPLQWRDRILEIYAASKEEEARHCAAMAAYDEERASLVAKLKAEGFALINGDEANSELEWAQDDIAQQDMSDPANWRAGDLVEFSVVKASSSFHKGGLYRFKCYDCDMITIERDDEGDENGWFISYFKWHSRPTN